MRFYKIQDDYIDFLRAYDSKVADNKSESRPYVGIVLETDGMKYYVPLTSPKQKHRRMHNSKDFRKIGGGQYGALNFNNMIPVPDSALIDMDFSQEPDPQYRRLLQNQYRAVSNDSAAIETTAESLRKLIFTDDAELSENDRKVKARCCNLPVLEQVFSEYHSEDGA